MRTSVTVVTLLVAVLVSSGAESQSESPMPNPVADGYRGIWYGLKEYGTWRIIGPTEPGPQLWRSGGEIAMWISGDEGVTWKKDKQLTTCSSRNHNYVRRPVDADPGFYALWADGHGNDKSAPCRIYFCNQAGDVRVLPETMSSPFARPERLERKGKIEKASPALQH